MDELIDQYLGQENPYLGIYAKADGIHLRIIAKGPNEGVARSMIEPMSLIACAPAHAPTHAQ